MLDPFLATALFAGFTTFFVNSATESVVSELALLSGIGINVLVTLLIELSTLVTMDNSSLAVSFATPYLVACGFCVLIISVLDAVEYCCFF